MPIYDLGLEHVGLAFATTTVFTDVTQGVFEGDRIGIVGRNGGGKSTLLQLLADNQQPDTGRVTRRHGLTFGMLDQRDPLDDAMTVREAALENREDYEWAADASSRDIVQALLGGISLDARVSSLSGGQRRRADLARLLLHDWDILALDEPTNHLDIVTIHWLAEHLKSRWSKGSGALLLVTHDRWFLDEVCQSMWEVHDGVIDPFEGGYSAYMLQRVERDRQSDVQETKRRNLVRKELAWLTRGARARSTKQKFHVKAANELIADVPPMRNALELKQMATSRLGKQVVDLIDVTQIFAFNDIRAKEAENLVQSPYAQAPLMGSVEVLRDADSKGASDSGVGEGGNGLPDDAVGDTAGMGNGDAAEPSEHDATSAARRVTISGRKVLDDVTWLIGPGDRFGIVGANGAGKSTLLSIIDGTLTPTVGRVNIGKTVKFAVLSQRLDELEELGPYRIQEVLARYKSSYMVEGKEVTPGQLMERLGFASAQLMTRIQDLSGGQKRRMQLLLILLNEPNVLIMDEPGNDLDTDMLAVMEDLLDTWPGTLIVVSHDRYLLERVTDQQYALLDGKVRHLPGGVDEYLQLVGVEQADEGSQGDTGNQAATGADAAPKGQQEAKAERNAKREAGKRASAIERKLAKLTQAREDIEGRMAQHDPADFEGLNALNEELQSAAQESDRLEEEWLELSELAES
ncbi:ABC-F family ATP-binding cassette domain-containing protein [Bifidobacterium psychraerophilum]|uniref:ABC transporter ATP-binding protein n=1 Tax=Bifidobacterium psychraerophilum TaxID=218140 RepID=A0A087CNH6_9BIFI|nr:ABC-F family ATP-binding cassette domain-containing protein [Bifidobacterium psychraerophilum]KFI84826.1 ABC transporter ATP-binding protein [Bifidobacterium psychraerophilum]PKA94041.1 ABC transporter ATP-binding protein [Bifidobacterium psychraerophilum DSM 22366]